MPADVHVVSLTSTSQGVAINMSVGTKSEVALAIEQLRTFESLYPESVTVNSVVEDIDEEAGTVSVNFAVSAVYKGAHAAEGAMGMDDSVKGVADMDDFVDETADAEGAQE